MGIGDEIMVTGEAVRLQQSDARPVAVMDGYGKLRTHEVWAHNPRIAKRLDGFNVQPLRGHYFGCRPYIARKTPHRWFYTDWRCCPGEIWMPDGKLTADGSGNYVVLEPHIKRQASPNKQWGWENWQRLAHLLKDYDLVQPGPPGVEILDGVRWMKTPDFMSACRVLAGARSAVLPEGGLHHAAAAIGLRAVVVFGAMVSPRNTGYDAHINLAVDAPELLGWRGSHPGCRAAMESITPETVAEHLRELL